jgi:glycosyltransferase involved in cell wall biosynthesis
MKQTIHVIAPFHSRLMKEKWSNCAFTQITLKQIQIFKMLGFHVIDYSNWGSESVADEHVEILTKDEFLNSFLDDGKPAHGNAEVGSPQWARWNEKICASVPKRTTSDGYHFVAHTFGNSAQDLIKLCPDALHLETHIGYDRPGFGARRVFVSEAWRNYLFGKYGSTAEDHRWSWVVLPYYDRADWPYVAKSPFMDGSGYVAYLGRLTPDKGLSTVVDIAARMPHLEFHIAGPGMTREAFRADYRPTNNVSFLGALEGKDRAAYYGNASVLLAPSEYLEPCAGVVCEAALCGTPTVASSWGGFMETIVPGVTGAHAATLAHWIDGIEFALTLERKRIAYIAERAFTLESASFKYDAIFERLLTLKGDGWYTLPNHLAQAV